MRFASLPLALAAGLALALAAAPARAHILLDSPPPLTANDDAKTGPCGCYFGQPEAPNGDIEACPAEYPVTEVPAGSQLTVTWTETVNHAGRFRLAIAPKSVETVKLADLDAAVVYDEADENPTSGATITATVTVPNEPCEGCTLQLRQEMEVGYYYSCAALRIVGESGPGPASASSAASSSGAGIGVGAGTAGAGGGAASGPGGVTGAGGGDLPSTGPGPAQPQPALADGSLCTVAAAPGARPQDAGLGSAMALLLAAAAGAAWSKRRRRGARVRAGAPLPPAEPA